MNLFMFLTQKKDMYTNITSNEYIKNWSKSNFSYNQKTITSKELQDLDRIRLSQGIFKMKSFFNEQLKNTKENAVVLLNHNNLMYSSLYLLKQDIINHKIVDDISTKNKIALRITEEILKIEKNSPLFPSNCCSHIQSVASILKWMLLTGSQDDGLSEEFDTILDITALLLTKIYKEKSVLPIIINMAFERNRRGANTHDLLWSFFEAKDPRSFILVANYLLSEHNKDIELAKKLLKFASDVNMTINTPPYYQYLHFISWLKENYFYLYFTGESFQQTNQPIPYVVVLEAKYLNKVVSIDTGKILESLSENDVNCIYTFRNLDQNTRIILTNFSHFLRHKDDQFWTHWLNSTISEQIMTAKNWLGVS